MDWNLLKILWLQPLNAWKSLTLPARLQHAFLLLLIYAYAGTRLFKYLNILRFRDPLLYQQLLWAAALLIAVFFLLSAPFLLRRVLPAQNGFAHFLILPLRPGQLRTLVWYYTHKYWIIVWAIFLPLPVALLTRDALSALLLTAFVLFADVVVLFVFFILFLRIHSSALFYGVAAAGAIIWMVICGFLWRFPAYWPIIGVFLLLSLSGLALLFKRSVRPSTEPWLALMRQTMRSSRTRRSVSVSGNRAKALFLRDWLNHLRNPSYLKTKLVLLLLLIFGGLIIFRSYSADKALLLFSAFWLGLIWWHYSGVFNRRFAQSEPEWFFRLVPLPFVRFVLMRFVNEFVFVVVMLGFYSAVLRASGFGFAQQWQWLLLLTFFSAVILLTMIAFRILFYDDPRTGGYAYHFSIIFFVVMTLNYYFTGPLLTLLFLIVYFYKSYRFLKD